MRLLITGTAGFIGYHLALALAKKNIDIYEGDSSNNYYNTGLRKTRLKESEIKIPGYGDRPISLYTATKKNNELMAYSYSSLYKTQNIELRFFTVYGPYGRPDMIREYTPEIPAVIYNLGEGIRRLSTWYKKILIKTAYE